MRARLVVPFVLVAMLVSGCVRNSQRPYQFRQEFDQIASIEILKIDYDYKTNSENVIKTIDSSMHRSVIDELLAVPGQDWYAPPPSDLGAYVFRITYKDGERELVGDCSNAYITANGDFFEKTNYAFQSEPFYALLSRLLDEKVTKPTRG